MLTLAQTQTTQGIAKSNPDEKGNENMQVTIGSSATPLIAPGSTLPSGLPSIITRCGVIIQNNAAHSCAFAVGDSSVTISTGIVLPSGSPGGVATLRGQIDMSKVYVAGTQGDAINFTPF